MFEQWIIDAALSNEQAFCFCPIEGDFEGDYSVYTGVNYISSALPLAGDVVGVWHPDGQGAVEAWWAGNEERVKALLDKERVG